MGSLFGAGGTKAAAKANQTSAQLAQQQAALAQEQWETYRPLVEAFVQGQLANYGMAQPYMGQMLQYALARLGGAPLMSQVAVPGISPTPGMSQVQSTPSGGIDRASAGTPMEQVGAALDAALGTTDAAAGAVGGRPVPPGTDLWYMTHDPNRTGEPLPGPSLVGVAAQPNLADPNPATAQTTDPLSQQFTGPGFGRTGTPATGAAPVEAPPSSPPTTPTAGAAPTMAFPQAAGPFDYDLERAAWERARTDIERAGAQGLAGLQSALGSRFGGSASPGSLAAGAGAELQSKMNEALIGARLGLVREQQAIEDARFQQVAQLLGGLSGINVAPATAAGGQAIQGLGSASQAYAQAAQAYAQQAAQRQQALGNLFYTIGAGAFGGLPGLGGAMAATPTISMAPPVTASGLGLLQPSPFWSGAGGFNLIP